MDHTEYIEAYLTDKLEANERQIFEHRLQDDQAFSQEYETQVAAYALVRRGGMARTGDLLRQHEKRTHSGRKPQRRIFLWVAAAAAVILFAVWIILPQNAGPSDQDLYAEYFAPYRDPVSVRGQDDMDPNRKTANDAYRTGNFALAAEHYLRIASPHAVDSFYYGLCALQNDASELAIPVLTKISSGTTDYQQQALWYLALAHLKAGAREEAKAVLTSVAGSESYNHVASAEILNKLR